MGKCEKCGVEDPALHEYFNHIVCKPIATKTLGQVAFEAWFTSLTSLIPDWSDTRAELRSHWEQAAQAVKSAYGNTQEGIEQSQSTHRAGYERGLAQGAAEERVRLAAMFDDMPRDDLSPMGVAETIRKSVKP